MSKVLDFISIINWLFNIPLEYRKAKLNWQKRGAAYKIFQVIFVAIFLGLTVLLNFYAFHLLTQFSAKDAEAAAKSFLLIFWVIIVFCVDFVMFFEMLKTIIIQTTTAFVCRPKKQTETVTETANSGEVKQESLEINTQTETITQADVVDKNSNENSSRQVLEITEKPKTSRAFDTTIGVIDLVLLFGFVVMFILSLVAGLSSK